MTLHDCLSPSFGQRLDGTPTSARKLARTRTPKKTEMDRFIPTRSGINLELAHFNLLNENQSPKNSFDSTLEVASPSKEAYKRQLAQRLLDADGDSAKILSFQTKAPAPPPGADQHLRELYTQNACVERPAGRRQFRHIPSAPERILDAPDLIDDYYLNLLDWGSNNNVAVALGSSVYLWNATSGEVQQLMQANTNESDTYITSLSWAGDGKHVAIGTSAADVQIWDAQAQRQVRTLRGHLARVSALGWTGTTLASGARDNHVLMHDVRIRDHVTARLSAHEQEVCGLKWAPSGQQLATGGNDNLLHIWDLAMMSNSTYLHRIDQHCAAVKALAWCPFQSNLLASGGGTADRCIKFWNTHTGALLNSVDTHSQVCALQWNQHEREILSSHGYSQNQLCLWKYPSMVKMAELTGHTSRVLHMAQSPDGQTVVSAAADETLRFWRVFGEPEGSTRGRVRAGGNCSKSIMKSINIR